MDMHDRIVKAASQIIVQKGIEAATTRQICRQVGISAPTLYHYFPNKQHLMEAITYGAYNAYLGHPEKTRNQTTPIKRLIAIWNQYFKFVEHEPEFFNVILNAHVQAKIPTAGYKLFETTINIFVEAQKRGLLKVSPQQAAQTFYAGALGSALLWVSQERKPKFKTTCRKSMKLILKSLFINSNLKK